ncbi:hypothetical protein H9I32_03860 [Bacillus sp. Xin]|uniref:hypothetical protein n=1 Tax=unclassified Bacillus (in: firmicutes) TaxID=185979 RepID=UPI00157495AD|nr:MULTISPECIES: hypothetical protein [unclassified Bacillus (in: firmicutes)]MBC6971594.1 hypothetical protein [Bacillus sp. Xin]NSW38324.1 hypothetical protein [Bacillus sp. Xin1]
MSEEAASYTFVIVMTLISILSIYFSVKLKSPHKYIPGGVMLILSIGTFGILYFDRGVMITSEGLGYLYSTIAILLFLIAIISLFIATANSFISALFRKN